MRTVGKGFENKAKKLTKKEVIEILAKKGIEFDVAARLDELVELIPKE